MLDAMLKTKGVMMSLELRQRTLPYDPTPMWQIFTGSFFVVGLFWWFAIVVAADLIYGPIKTGTPEGNTLVLRVGITASLAGIVAATIICNLVRRHRRRVIANLPDDRYFDGNPQDYWEWVESDAYDAWCDSDTYSEWGDWDEYDEYAN